MVKICCNLILTIYSLYNSYNIFYYYSGICIIDPICMSIVSNWRKWLSSLSSKVIYTFGTSESKPIKCLIKFCGIFALNTNLVSFLQRSCCIYNNKNKICNFIGATVLIRDTNYCLR